MSGAAVLRCGRCGRFADWRESHLQIVCTCRPHLELLPILVREGTEGDRETARRIFTRHFGHTPMVAFGEVIDAAAASLLVAEAERDTAAALAWREHEGALHIIALATDPMWQRAGLGGHLVAELELLARRRAHGRVVATIMNDNIPALYFYQRRGYRVTAVVPEPGPARATVAGFGGIPIRDEIHLGKTLGPEAAP
jgi:ribosomal protein S18 acetylase RimI-like enzyme